VALGFNMSRNVKEEEESYKSEFRGGGERYWILIYVSDSKS